MLLTNCTNCGAPLKFKEEDYGKLAKCSYCDTEYHLDLLGRVEEYKVKLKIMGEVKEFYISEIEREPELIDCNYLYDNNSHRYSTIHRYRHEIKLIEL